ncbi:hypothetical protein Tco_0598473 [Tanacetum coccineum]
MGSKTGVVIGSGPTGGWTGAAFVSKKVHLSLCTSVIVFTTEEVGMIPDPEVEAAFCQKSFTCCGVNDLDHKRSKAFDRMKQAEQFTNPMVGHAPNSSFKRREKTGIRIASSVPLGGVLGAIEHSSIVSASGSTVGSFLKMGIPIRRGSITTAVLLWRGCCSQD